MSVGGKGFRAACRGVAALARVGRVAIVWSALGLLAGLLALLAVGMEHGYSTLTVMSGSMEPAVHTGDVVVARRISPREAKVGDVVTFKHRERAGKLVTHRVRGMRLAGRSVHFVTQGDANNTVERWSMASNGSMGRVAFRLPKLGYALAEVRTPSGRLLYLILPATVLAALELVRIWRRPRRRSSP